MQKYKNTLKYFIKKTSSQDISILKIIRNNRLGHYNVYSQVTKHIHNSTPQQFLVNTQLKLKNSSHRPDEYTVSDWDEKLLKKPTREMTDNNIYVGKNSTVNILLPCDGSHVSAGQRQKYLNIDYKVVGNRHIKFYTNSDYSSNALYRLNCGKRYFKVNLFYKKDVLTLFRALPIAQSYLPRKLTLDEKMNKYLEEEHNFVVTE